MRISDWSSDVCSSDLPERLPSDAEVGDNRLRNLVGVMPAPPVRAPLRRLIEWTADYYLAPTAAVARMTLASTSALEGGRTITEYRAPGTRPGRLTPNSEQATARNVERQGLTPDTAITHEGYEGGCRGWSQNAPIRTHARTG